MKTKSVLLLCTAAVLFMYPLLFAQDAAVHLAGIRVTGPGYGLNGTELQAFHESSGVTLVLAVELTGAQKIVEVDDDKSAVSLFKDDQGKNLLDNVRWGGFPKVSEDGRTALIEVSSKAVPTSGAVSMQVSGTVRVQAAESFSTEKLSALSLEAGNKATCGQESIEVLKTGLEDETLVVVIQMSRKLKDNIKEIRFSTVAGEAIGLSGTGSMTFGNASQVEYYLDHSELLSELNIEIDVWQALEVLDIPFELKTGIGL